MKSYIFRLGSVGAHMVGGPETGALDLIYSYLLQEFKQDIYSHIHINQIGEDLNEVILKEGKKIHVNIRYPAYDNFEQKSIYERNKIRLDVIHAGLLRIAEYDKKLSIEKLEAIRNKIVNQNFDFKFHIKDYPGKKKSNIIAKVIVHPLIDRFDYYVIIEKENKVKCEVLIYSAGTNLFYFPYFFKTGKWLNENQLVLTGSMGELETHIFIDECRVVTKNLTQYKNPPYYTLIKFGITELEKEAARKDWQHSLPPSISGIIRPDINN
ncbi:MAG: hypothetical protein NTW29_18645 [Bacteroidetes bacterium]|nr:hypothetical protein [Bacteroidota bacterium]